jgi:predicted O-linked N-acetylglucosamine transferase (SPINDLY family)
METSVATNHRGADDMITQTPQELMEMAMINHRSGRLADAEILYRQVLERQPRYPGALHLLGLVAFQSGRPDVALELINQAIELQPNSPDYHLNRGVVLDQIGRSVEAVAALERSIALKPDLPEAHANLANALRKSGRLDEAIAASRRALQLRENYVEAHLNLGNALQDKGEIDQAIASFSEVVRLRPDFAEAHHNLGNALALRGRLDESVAAQKRAIELKPDFAQAIRTLGAIRQQQGMLDEAISLYRKAAEANPTFSLALVSLGEALRQKGELAEAITALRQAVMAQPNIPDGHYALGSALFAAGDPQAAQEFGATIALRPDFAPAHSALANTQCAAKEWARAAGTFRQAVVLRPDFAEAYSGLGNALSNLGQMDSAISAFRRAISLKPALAQAHGLLGVALSTCGEMDEAIASLRQAAALAPEDASIQNNLGSALQKIGQLDAAIACYQRAVELAPNHVMADSNRVYALYFHPDFDAQAILREHRVWSERHAKPLQWQIPHHANDRAPERKLRIGYISPDFREHVVGWELLPLLSEHDRAQFEIYCYSNLAIPDDLTDRLRSHAEVWRNIYPLDDQAVAEMVHADQIDILVDLTLHMANNRLLVFARKPAPVQVTYLGYAGSTGLETIDYRFSDPHLDPLETDLTCYSEATIRLPRSYWCYHPGGDAPDVSPSPASAGSVTFGCLNNFSKVSSAAMDLFSQVLIAVPGSKLILQCPAGSHRLVVADEFFRRGVAADRVEFVPLQDWPAYMQTYHRIDIALDPIPYGGGITTCDGLWMGVPAVTLSAATAVGRGGRTILNNVGLGELVASTAEDYVRIAADLAKDPARLAELRGGLRQRMREAPLMDDKRFARDVEAAYRQMWKRWCEGKDRE